MLHMIHMSLTHWGQWTHTCVNKLIIIGSDNGLSPGRHQAIIWTNALILLTGPLGANVSEILNALLKVSFNKMRLNGSSAKLWPFHQCVKKESKLRLWDTQYLVQQKAVVWRQAIDWTIPCFLSIGVRRTDYNENWNMLTCRLHKNQQWWRWNIVP